MQTQYKLDNGAIEAKLKVLNTLKDFIQIKHTLTGEVQKIAQEYQVDFPELWSWTTEQMFSEGSIRSATPEAVETVEAVETAETKLKAVPAKAGASRKPLPAESFNLASTDDKIEMIRKTEDATLLAVAIKDSNRFVRTEAIKHPLTPQRHIEAAVKDDTNLKIQRIAIRYATNQTFLEDLALKGNGVDPEVRQKAIRKLTNKKVLQSITATQTDSALIKAAAKTICEL